MMSFLGSASLRSSSALQGCAGAAAAAIFPQRPPREAPAPLRLLRLRLRHRPGAGPGRQRGGSGEGGGDERRAAGPAAPGMAPAPR